jgi:hypothetical protein
LWKRVNPKDGKKIKQALAKLKKTEAARKEAMAAAEEAAAALDAADARAVGLYKLNSVCAYLERARF